MCVVCARKGSNRERRCPGRGDPGAGSGEERPEWRWDARAGPGCWRCIRSRWLRSAGRPGWRGRACPGRRFRSRRRFSECDGGVETFFLELAAVKFGLGTEIEESQQQGLIAGLLALGLEFLEMIGIGNALATLVAAEMGGDEFFVVKQKELVGLDFEAQPLRGVKRRHRIAIGLEGDMAAAT